MNLGHVLIFCGLITVAVSIGTLNKQVYEIVLVFKAIAEALP